MYKNLNPSDFECQRNRRMSVRFRFRLHHIPNLFDPFCCLPLICCTFYEPLVGILMSPARTQRSALSDVTQQQQNIPDQATYSSVAFDQTAFLSEEAEAFALEPIDVTAVG